MGDRVDLDKKNVDNKGAALEDGGSPAPVSEKNESPTDLDNEGAASQDGGTLAFVSEKNESPTVVVNKDGETLAPESEKNESPAIPDHKGAAPQHDGTLASLSEKNESPTLVGSTEFLLELVAKNNTDTLYVVWHEKITMAIACAVHSNSSNTMLIVQDTSEASFLMSHLFDVRSEFLLYVGDDVQQELSCFFFGSKLSALLSTSEIHTDFEALDSEIRRYASYLHKSVVHIIQQNWAKHLTKSLKDVYISKDPI